MRTIARGAWYDKGQGDAARKNVAFPGSRRRTEKSRCASSRDSAHRIEPAVAVSCAAVPNSPIAEEPMQQPVEAPTPEALADLVARCSQINRYTTQLVAVEETRIAALAAGILTMRGVLELSEIKAEKLPMRQGRIGHWSLMGHHLDV